MTLENLNNPFISYQVFQDVGITKVPFSALNSTILDMLSTYAKDLLLPDDYSFLIDTAEGFKCKESLRSYLYIYKAKHYKLFLQMIALENHMSGDKLTYTTSHSVLYSGQADAGYDKCRIFSASDCSLFDNIENTEYKTAFDSEHLHLIRLSTTTRVLDKGSSDITEYSLYIPY